MFNHKVLDMLELHLDAEAFRRISQFKNTRKFAIGSRPLLVFSGPAFESPVSNSWTQAKSLLTDFFRGEGSDKIDAEGIQYLISITADEAADGDSTGGDANAIKGALRLRCYMIQTKRSGQPKFPRVEVEEIGVRIPFSFFFWVVSLIHGSTCTCHAFFLATISFDFTTTY